MGKQSYFDGGLLGLVFYRILGILLTILTFGICYPLAFCMIYSWEISHTVIDNKRLYFDGSSLQLFGLWLKWGLLCIITFGIYSFWVPISLNKWKCKHTHFIDI